MKKAFFVIVILMLGLNQFGYTQSNQEEKPKNNKAFIDIGGGQSTPLESHRLSEEEVEKVREEMRVLQNSIDTSVSARNAQNALKAAKSAVEAKAALNSVKEVQAKKQ